MSGTDGAKTMQPLLPAYKIRRSKRARHLQLKVSHFAQVEVVVPMRCDTRTAEAFVREHSAWLQETVARVRAERACQPELDVLLPAAVQLPAVGERWRVEYAPARRRYRETFHAGPVVVVAQSSPEQMRRALGDWLANRARRRLLPWLRELSTELNLPYRSASIRAQRTRWGSCSSRHVISLNRNLLFVDAPVTRYLMIHELCHTVHMNHSSRFWSLVQRLCPDYRQHEQQLDAAVRAIPLWAGIE